MGCDHNERPLPGAANQIAAPIWANFMAEALAAKPIRDFVIPNDVTQVEICTETGAKATAFLPQTTGIFLNRYRTYRILSKTPFYQHRGL